MVSPRHQSSHTHTSCTCTRHVTVPKAGNHSTSGVPAATIFCHASHIGKKEPQTREQHCGHASRSCCSVACLAANAGATATTVLTPTCQTSPSSLRVEKEHILDECENETANGRISTVCCKQSTADWDQIVREDMCSHAPATHTSAGGQTPHKYKQPDTSLNPPSKTTLQKELK